MNLNRCNPKAADLQPEKESNVSQPPINLERTERPSKSKPISSARNRCMFPQLLNLKWLVVTGVTNYVWVSGGQLHCSKSSIYFSFTFGRTFLDIDKTSTQY